MAQKIAVVAGFASLFVAVVFTYMVTQGGLEELQKQTRALAGRSDLDALREELAVLRDDLQSLGRSQQSLSGQLSAYSGRLNKLETMSQEAAAIQPSRPLGGAAAVHVDANVAATVDKLLAQYAEPLGLDDSQKEILSHAIKRTFATMMPVFEEVRNGSRTREEAESMVLSALEKMTQQLSTEGTLTAYQIDQIRSGLPEVLRKMSKSL